MEAAVALEGSFLLLPLHPWQGGWGSWGSTATLITRVSHFGQQPPSCCWQHWHPVFKEGLQGTSNGIEDLSPSCCSEARLLSILSSHCRTEFSTGSPGGNQRRTRLQAREDVQWRAEGVAAGRQQAGKANTARSAPAAAAPMAGAGPCAHPCPEQAAHILSCLVSEQGLLEFQAGTAAARSQLDLGLGTQETCRAAGLRDT